MSRQLSAVEGVVGVSVDMDSATATVQVLEGTSPETVCAGVTGRYSAKIRP